MRVLMAVAVVCFALALLGAAHVVNGVNVIAWLSGGLLAWAVDVAAGGYVLPARRGPP